MKARFGAVDSALRRGRALAVACLFVIIHGFVSTVSTQFFTGYHKSGMEDESHLTLF